MSDLNKKEVLFLKNLFDLLSYLEKIKYEMGDIDFLISKIESNTASPQDILVYDEYKKKVNLIYNKDKERFDKFLNLKDC